MKILEEYAFLNYESFMRNAPPGSHNSLTKPCTQPAIL